MNALTETLRHPRATAPLTQVHYTICPVLVASAIAVELGWWMTANPASQSRMHCVRNSVISCLRSLSDPMCQSRRPPT